MFGIGARRVVALLANFPGDAVPDLLQIFQRRAEDRAGIAPDLQHAFAVIDAAALRPGGTDDVAVLRQTVCAQDLHHRRFVGAAHLQHHAQLFVKQSLQRALFAPRADLGRPVFAVAHVHAAVGYAVAIDEQHVHIQGHAHAPGKGHLSHGGQQAAVAAVVVGQNFSVGAQGVDGVHQAKQQLRIVQIGRFVAHLV